eukprot:6284666-Amphidinium_carterae.1
MSAPLRWCGRLVQIVFDIVQHDSCCWHVQLIRKRSQELKRGRLTRKNVLREREQFDSITLRKKIFMHKANIA